ncbi:hypothetical protein SAMN05216266_12938 [Amycolatopsis marina]|uniref:LppX_LprAFG lipoprotein n=1 Tax=Amycolatopsis marina TaxID=490629 RepID=A0A1I1CIP7_9PSEU|nr:hypothetical protein [Amycolatopsis marina]SFB61932.1 hypothetical protein SAMN05216266_12938 [Amycolatopsis marina]
MRKTALAAGGFALVIALTGCGGGDDNASGNGSGGELSSPFGSAQELVRAASAQTEKSKSSKFTFEMDMAGQKFSGNGEGLYDGDNTAMSMNMDVQGQTMEMRIVDKVLYMKMPAQAGMTADGKPWVKITPGGDDPISKSMGDSFDQMAEQNDPSKTLEQIEKAGTITNTEQVELNGEQTTHYSVELDMKKLAEQMPDSPNAKAVEQMQGKIDTLPMELWLNSDQLPVQIVMDMSKIAEAAGQPQAGGQMTMKYTDWGAPVDVEAPPADQVGEFSMPK